MQILEIAKLNMDQLQQLAKKEGVSIDGTRRNLIVRLAEHFHAPRAKTATVASAKLVVKEDAEKLLARQAKFNTTTTSPTKRKPELKADETLASRLNRLNVVKMTDAELKTHLAAKELPIDGDEYELLIRLLESMEKKNKKIKIKPAEPKVATTNIAVKVDPEVLARRQAKFGTVQPKILAGMEITKPSNAKETKTKKATVN